MYRLIRFLEKIMLLCKPKVTIFWCKSLHCFSDVELLTPDFKREKIFMEAIEIHSKELVNSSQKISLAA